MTRRKTMNTMFLSILTFISLISASKQLFCSTNCPIIQVNYPDPFIEPTNYDSCRNDTSIKICKGQITAFYQGKNFPTYINYTFGTIGNASKSKNENYTNEYGLDNLTKYQVIINAKTEETRIITDIYCQTGDECALTEIKKLFVKYNNQRNPFHTLKSLIYVDPPPEKLYCFDRSNDSSTECTKPNDNHPICLSDLKNFKQECSSNSDVQIHEQFIVPSPPVPELIREDEFVKCNKDNCNSNEELARIQIIAKQYAFGIGIMKNNAQEHRDRITQIFSILFLMFFIRLEFVTN